MALHCPKGIRVTRIAELIENPSCFTEEPCDLIVDGDVSVQEAVRAVLDAGADSLGISHPDFEQPVFLSRSQLLELMVRELDTIQEKMNDLQVQLEQQMQNQIELMEVGAACLLEARKNKLESAVQNLIEGMILLNENGYVEQVNEVAARMLGLSETADRRQVGEVLEQLGCGELIRSGEIHQPEGGEFQIKSANRRLLRVRWKRIYDEWKHPLGLALCLRDITDEIAAENTKNDFITAISHELRTPLTSIQNSVSNILAGVTGKIAGKTRQYLYTMKQDCHRFADLINDLLDMAKLEAGNMPIACKVMDLDSLIRTTVKEFQEEAQKTGIQLNCRTAGTITPIYADIKKIRQVLCNLIRNAIQFTPAGGRITVSLETQGNNIVTCVQDTGVGISPEIQKYIFTKFYQVARQAGPGSKGSGLGLAICKGIVQIHGGLIWLESEPSKGSRFYFSLPKTDPQLILRRHLETLSHGSSPNPRRMALLMVRFEPAGSQCELQAVKDAAGPIINELLAQSRFFLTCGTDLALQTDDREIVFLINEFGQQKIEKVCKRIDKMIHHHLKKNFSAPLILPMMAAAEYPTDVSDPAQLSIQARAKLTETACAKGPGDRE
jgi:two-component system phosphate regulon sensor histidine kinase PhoR